MLTEYQESTLTSGGDCFDHWHSNDRVRTHDDVEQLQRLTSIVNVVSDMTAQSSQDFLLCDTTLANITITLPIASGGTELTITKTAAPYALTIVPASGETLIGATGVIIRSRFTSLHIKAVKGIGWFAI